MATIYEFPYSTFAEVSLRALVRNATLLRNLSGKEVIPVVKADAYGHGVIPVAMALYRRAHCHTFAVATLEEGLELRRKLGRATILVLSGFAPHQLDAYLKFHLTPVVNSLAHLKSLEGRSALPKLHLMVETGLNRLGINPAELQEAIEVLRKLPDKIAGICSHLAESDYPGSSFNDKQGNAFAQIVKHFQAERVLQTDAKIHLGNSGAILQGKLEQVTNAVRPGLALYGVSPNPKLDESDALIPVLQWKARILSIKQVARGDTVGYGRTYKVKKKERLAILPVGYADGIPRSLGNNGYVLIQGKRAAIRGRVSMDLTSVDCTQIPGAKDGTLVTLIGRDGKEELSSRSLAVWAKTIPYEVLCRISTRVPRVYFE